MTGPIRSLLYVPGTRPDRFDKAMNAGADAVVFDLEDSVEPSQKPRARQEVAAYFATPSSGALRLVRFNAPGTPEGRADEECFGGMAGFDGIVLPKVESAAAIEETARAVAGRGAGEAPPIVPLLETPRGILGAASIAAAAARVPALLFGAEDLTARLGVERSVDGEELLFARGQIALAAAATGADAIDAVVTNLSDMNLLRRDCVRARGLGFRGKMAIHPSQVAVINEVFSPTARDVERARRIVEAFESASAAGKGVTTLDGAMIERPIAERARRTLDLAARFGSR